ncbi:MAG: DHH family phosphoesterase [Candidatus Fimenecus sp.]
MKAGRAIRTYPLSFALIILSAVFCIVTAFLDWRVALVETCLLLGFTVAAALKARHDFKVIRKTVASINASLSAEENSSLTNFPLPVAVFDSSDRVVWYNQKFNNAVLTEIRPQSDEIGQFTGGKGLQQIREKTVFPVKLGKKEYTVYFSHITCSGRQSYVLIYTEDTALKQTAAAYKLEKPAVVLLAVDSADEIYRAYKENEYAEILGDAERMTEGWLSEFDGIFRKLSSGRFFAVLPEAELRKMITRKFNLLEQVRAYTYNGASVGITLSVGVGRGDTLADAENNARQAFDMALGRGGDQAVLKGTDESYQFFGGVSKGVEKRTKVRSRVVANALGELLQTAENVVVMGHKFSDLDCVGAAIGMCKAATALGKPAKIAVNEKTTLAQPLIAYMRAQIDSDIFVSPETAEHMLTEKSLLIVVDTHKTGFVESPEVYEKAKQVVVIDHHRKNVDYIQNAVIFYHEPHASSTCELVTELLQYIGKKPLITPIEANALLAGIMLDTKEFVLRTGVRTFEAAAYLRARGADTVTVKSFFASSMENRKLRGQIVMHAQSYKRCAVSVADFSAKDLRVVCAQAADELLTVSDVDASFVLFETDGTANISARSMGKVNVQLIMESLGGGGHQTMSAAQLADTALSDAEKQLYAAIDAYFENQ